MKISQECKVLKTSKAMLPCWRRVHLHKSSSFKKETERILKHSKNDAKNDPKMIDTSVKKKHQKNAKNVKLSDVGSHVGAISLTVPWGSAFFS